MVGRSLKFLRSLAASANMFQGKARSLPGLAKGESIDEDDKYDGRFDVYPSAAPAPQRTLRVRLRLWSEIWHDGRAVGMDLEIRWLSGSLARSALRISIG